MKLVFALIVALCLMAYVSEAQAQGIKYIVHWYKAIKRYKATRSKSRARSLTLTTIMDIATTTGNIKAIGTAKTNIGFYLICRLDVPIPLNTGIFTAH